MIVLKFGGTSVASREKLENIEAILRQKTSHWLLVVSAMARVTSILETLPEQAQRGEHADTLAYLQGLHEEHVKSLNIKDEQQCLGALSVYFDELTRICEGIHVLEEVSSATFARVCAFGETLSATIIGFYLLDRGLSVTLLDSSKTIIAEGDYRNATVIAQPTRDNIQRIDKSKNYITGGFTASNAEGKAMLLGRGGSDYTASIFAANLNASVLEIWSDVNGMLNANPVIVSDATPIANISYKEALEMAYFGAKVLYPPTIQPVMQANIPVRLKNTAEPEQAGTLISDNALQIDDVHVGNKAGDITGITSLTDISLLNFTGVGLARTVGAAKRFFSALEAAQVNIILISQSCSENSICIAIKRDDATRAQQTIETTFASDIHTGLVNPITVIDNMSVVAVVGDKMKHRTGLAGLVFQALGQNGINLYALAQGSSERNISMVVRDADERKAVNAIYQRFFRHTQRRVNLFVAGTGNVGGAFLQILATQIETLRTQQQLDIRLIGLANSRRMLFDAEGLRCDIDVSAEGIEYADFGNFVDAMSSLNLANSVFVDNTASADVSAHYEAILQRSIAVVTCNKIAQSDTFSRYQTLKTLSKRKQAAFCYETAVGAALPILRTIHDLRQSGDMVLKIQAVLSGSLNFIFNQYDGTTTFADIVRRAADEGYTEPNPLIDLSGLDVIRKLLILAREAGYAVEASAVKFSSFLPETCLQTKDNAALFAALEVSEAHFKSLYEAAQAQGAKLKVVAEMAGETLSVGLQHITPENPFYHLENKDNIVAITTARYADDPLIIKGAGAGAEVTASGVFSDVLFAVNQARGVTS